MEEVIFLAVGILTVCTAVGCLITYAVYSAMSVFTHPEDEEDY